MGGGEILLLTPSWTSLVIVQRVVGRLTYSPQAGHLSSSFGSGHNLIIVRRVVGRFSYSPQAGHNLVFFQHVMGRFSYSPQVGHLSSSSGGRWGDSLTHPKLDISRHCSACGGEIHLLAPGWTSPIIIQRWTYSCHHSASSGEILLLIPGWT